MHAFKNEYETIPLYSILYLSCVWKPKEAAALRYYNFLRWVKTPRINCKIPLICGFCGEKRAYLDKSLNRVKIDDNSRCWFRTVRGRQEQYFNFNCYQMFEHSWYICLLTSKWGSTKGTVEFRRMNLKTSKKRRKRIFLRLFFINIMLPSFDTITVKIGQFSNNNQPIAEPFFF